MRKKYMYKKISLLILLSMNCYHTIHTQTRGIQLIDEKELRYNLLAPLNTRTLVLSSPGNYKFSSGMKADLTTSTTIICITSSDVTLDLQNFTVSQKNADTSENETTGIHIQNNLSNVVIKNGKINNINGRSIIIGENCFNITLHNMFITKTKIAGIEVQQNANTVRISNCLVANAISSDKTYTGIKLTDNTNISLDHCSVIRLAGTINFSCYGIFAKNCSNCSLTNSVISGIKGKHSIGVALNTCVDWVIENNESSGNVALNGTSTGLYLVKSVANRITNFETSNNHGTNDGNGIQVKVNSNYNRFINCTTSNNYSTGTGNGYGMIINKGDSNYISNITSFANSGSLESSSEGVGIKIQESKGNLIEKSKCDDNNGNHGTGYGILLENSEHCIIENNKLYYNHGLQGSWGIQEIGTPSSFVASNIAFGNQINFGLKQQTLNSIQNVQYDSPRSVQTSHRGNVNIIGV